MPARVKTLKFGKLVKKGFGNLTLQEMQALQRLFSNADPIVMKDTAYGEHAVLRRPEGGI